MKILCLSDTHGYLPDIPYKVDLVLHAGDFCPNKYGTRDKFFDGQFQYNWITDYYLPWVKKIQTRYWVQCCGNHDFVGEIFKLQDFDWPKNFYYLQNSSIEIEGIRIWGSPFTLHFLNWAFNAPDNESRGDNMLSCLYQQIPYDTSVIVTHQPPLGYGDKVLKVNRPQGSKALLDRMKELSQLKLLVCGHIHESAGEYNVDKIKVINASICTRSYKPTNPTVIIEI